MPTTLADPLLEGLSEEQKRAIQHMIDEQVKERMERFKEEESKKTTNSNAPANKLPGAKTTTATNPAITPAQNKAKTTDIKNATVGKPTT